MRQMKMRMKALLGCLVLALALGTAGAGAVLADEAAESRQSSYEAGMQDTQVDPTASGKTKQADAEKENNDGDDTYISNNGTVFQIPRVEDNARCIYDFADIFTDEQEAALKAEIDKIVNVKDAAILIITSDDVPLDAYYSTETSMRYARQFMVDNGIDGDAFVCMMDFSNRVFWACGYGKYGDVKYTGWGTKVYDKAKSAMGRGDYMEAARIYIREVNRLDNKLLAAIPTPFSLIVSAVLTLIVLLVLSIRHGTSQPSRYKAPSPEVKGYETQAHNQNFMGTTVSRRHIPRSTGGGGGGHSGGGGGFSAGSGGSHSGGGGHF